jgi:hypothetical protein
MFTLDRGRTEKRRPNVCRNFLSAELVRCSNSDIPQGTIVCCGARGNRSDRPTIISLSSETGRNS